MKIKIKHVAAALAKVECLSKRAVKLGFEPIMLHLGEASRDDIEVTLTGKMPVLNGWHLVASLNHGEADETIVNVIDGEVLPERYRTSWQCEHCQTQRNRKDTFVVQHENGDYKQVGRQCLADFIGTTDAERWLAISLLLAEAWASLEGAENDEWSGWASAPAFDLYTFLSWAEGAIWAFGWAGSREENSTRSIAWSMCEGNHSLQSAYSTEMAKRTRTKIVDIEAVIAWAKAQPTEDVDDYLYNLGVIARTGYVTPKTAGYAASMIMAYQRAEQKRLEMAQQQASSRHFGTVGKREVFELVLKRIIPIESYYGVSYLHIFHDASNNRAIWFGSKTPFEPGNAHKIKATVKDHNTREGVAQTVLTRCAHPRTN